MKLGQNFVKYFVPFLGNGVSRKNAFEIYWPLPYSSLELILMSNVRNCDNYKTSPVSFYVGLMWQWKIWREIEPWWEGKVERILFNTMRYSAVYVYKVWFAMNFANHIWRFKNVSEIEFKTLFGSSFELHIYDGFPVKMRFRSVPFC